jgi:hypothetical protein
MALHRLEVYVDSYKSKPFITEYDERKGLSHREERQLQDWLSLLLDRQVRIDSQLRVEDIKHHFMETARNMVHATCLRVSIIE